ncbi:polymorphic toxin-type HINT domain-containing protein [Streptomyces sp. SM14]|uniref:polymorphic toxin-type HINT domain-containing protein n=1 Tax=Streptomyces sp. SM14 TaxID=1736045 RepID=UPI000CD5B674|nr:polymorphic toxin-type HINT domain-containing protein [Streptomyces sp. SM14]
MADGSTKPIEQVAVGDEVLAADPETGQIGPRTVTAEITGAGEKNLVAVTIGEATITATDEHPFWSPESGEWTHATDLKPGQLLELPDRTHAPVTTLHRWTQPATVHNLTIEGLHTYYVLAGQTPVLVHNSNCNLAQHEAAGGHAIARHVGKTDAELAARNIRYSSTFTDLAAAERATSGNLAANQGQISQ